MDNFPEDIVSIQCWTTGTYSTAWTIWRKNYYHVSGVPDTWFDGIIDRLGAYTNDNQQYNWYLSAVNARLAVPTDVTIDIERQEVAPQTYDVSTTVGIDANGQAKEMVVEVVQVLDYYPYSGDHQYRNCVRQDAPPETVTLNPGESATFVWRVTLQAENWDNKEDVKIVGWARVPGTSGPKEIYNAGQLQMFPPIPGDLDHDGDVDLMDLSILLSHYGMGGATYEQGDINGDGNVNLTDLGILLSHYGDHW